MSKVLSFFKHKEQTGRRIIITDELLDALGTEYRMDVQNNQTELTFQQWIERRMASWY